MPRSDLSRLQAEFVACETRWVTWVLAHHGWELTHGEGYVGDTDAADGDYDGPHLQQGGHYKRLASDWNLWVHDDLITDGTHQVWQVIGEKWEGMHPRARWGGRFGDSNHISFEHGGVR